MPDADPPNCLQTHHLPESLANRSTVDNMTAIPGLITRTSPYSVRETIDKLEALLIAKGIKRFARIDQAAEAKAAGLEMPPMELLMFGNPKAGTPVMLAVPEAGIDLPLKIIAWQDHLGAVHVATNDSSYLESRFHLPTDTVKPLAVARDLVNSVTA
jgi:uncharacterized protein (DUF302 family)